ncbi:DUF4145 domain-containing protein [Paraburkholderia acidipaludis]|uniref:DUF4145 domain-containing protein n=1 Tax=Paraburkholderia acidipaludis TaxID=660537 RepID=UPI000A005921|nr:DUF4145 domain-containing protein [Paraburkholderia acidipaludis]
MDEPLNVESSIPEGKHLTAACDECNRHTRHKVLAQTHVHWEYGDGEVNNWIDYQIVQCQGCLSISFCEESLCSADIMYGESDPPVERRLFPNRIVGRAMMEEAQQLPENVYGIYEEAHSALCAELLIMAGFGVRAILEAVCKDQGIAGRNLKIKIDKLAEAGLITSSGATILQHLRSMGNAAVHEMKLHAQFQISAAFDVIEYLLQGVYILPKQAELLLKPTANSSQSVD